MKGKVLVILSVVAGLHLIIIGGIFMSGGCKHPEVLQDRVNVPPPVDKLGGGALEAPKVEPAAPDTSLAKPMLPEFKTELLKHTVAKGESFWTIAKKYGISKEELAAQNDIPLDKPLKIGTVLTIPPGGLLAPEGKHVPAEKAEKKASDKKHGVIEGELLKESAAASAKETKGTKEKLPADGAYVVKNNDSIWKIAAKFGVPSQKIIEANKLDPKKSLQIGQKIIIPTGSETSAVAKTTAPAAAPKTGTSSAAESPSELDKILDEGTTSSAAPVKPESGVKPAAGAASPAAAPIVPDTSAVTDFINHEVVDGEALSDVANMYGVKPEDIRKLNPEISVDDKLKTGSTLKIPQQ